MVQGQPPHDASSNLLRRFADGILSSSSTFEFASLDGDCPSLEGHGVNGRKTVIKKERESNPCDPRTPPPLPDRGGGSRLEKRNQTS